MVKKVIIHILISLFIFLYGFLAESFRGAFFSILILYLFFFCFQKAISSSDIKFTDLNIIKTIFLFLPILFCILIYKFFTHFFQLSLFSFIFSINLLGYELLIKKEKIIKSHTLDQRISKSINKFIIITIILILGILFFSFDIFSGSQKYKIFEQIYYYAFISNEEKVLIRNALNTFIPSPEKRKFYDYITFKGYGEARCGFGLCNKNFKFNELQGELIKKELQSGLIEYKLFWKLNPEDYKYPGRCQIFYIPKGYQNICFFDYEFPSREFALKNKDNIIKYMEDILMKYNEALLNKKLSN